MPRLEWVGKDKVVNLHQEVPYKILDYKYSYINGEINKEKNSQNMIIKGDNLEALKALLPKYEGVIKCIYIDPPYNTGNEKWCYNDNVNDSKIKKWLGEVVGKEGEDLSRHDKWLCMMYPRLKLLHKLLSVDGAIFISIDDNEQANLKIICDEIFGVNNFISCQIWQKKNGGGNDSKYIAVEHEYVITYAKNKANLPDWFINYDEEYLKRYNEEDEDGIYFWDTFMRASGKQYYPIKCPDGSILEFDKNGNKLSWLRSETRFLDDLQKGKVRIIKINDSWSVHFKQYASKGKKPRSIILNIANNSDAKKEMLKIFSQQKVFDYPKPYQLVQHLISTIAGKDSIVLDSFAGSGTTAHAVLNMNKLDEGNRKFILVEMEDYAENITAERVKRVIKGYEDVEGTGGDFSFFELGQPLLINNEYINEDVEMEIIRDYIFFMETRIQIDKQKLSQDNKYFLGEYNNAAYYFYYEKDKVSTLNHEFLSKIKTKVETYVIYADINVLSEDELLKYHIVFKKTPRDIARL